MKFASGGALPPHRDRGEAVPAILFPGISIIEDPAAPPDEIRFVSHWEEDGEIRYDMVVLKLDEESL